MASIAGWSWGKEVSMQDLVFVAITVAFFLVSIAYVRFCDKVK
jgi:hypothetical protein